MVMLAVIVSEGLLGTTRTVADAIADGIRDADPAARASCGPAAEVGAEVATADLLIVGAPTRSFGRRARVADGCGPAAPSQFAGAAGPGRPHQPNTTQEVSP
jgi:flavorubredoxin